MNSRTTASPTAKVIDESVSRSRGSATSGSTYYKIIRASINIKKGQRPKITAALPISNLLFSFGPTITRQRDDGTTTMTTDAILEDVLATIATTTPQSSETAAQEHRQTKRVSFSTKTDIKYIPTRHEISSNECKEAWYSRAELDSISESCLEQIHSITNNNDSNNYFHLMGGDDIAGSCISVDEGEESSCIRGLESFTPVAFKAKNMHRLLSVQAILNEQNRQKQQRRGLGKEDHQHDDDRTEALRMIYHGISHSSQLWARALALKDRREVEDMMMDDDECSTGKTSAIIATSLTVVQEKPMLHDDDDDDGGGGSRSICRMRVISRRHSSKSSSCNTVQLSPPKITAKAIPLDEQEASSLQMVMAIAA